MAKDDQEAKPFVNRREIESPLEHWPGRIVIPVEITPEDFAKYWEINRRIYNDKDDERHLDFKLWEQLFHVVKDWRIEGVTHEMLDETGLKIPSMKLMGWVTDEVARMMSETMELPNLDAPSSNGEKPSEMAPSQ